MMEIISIDYFTFQLQWIILQINGIHKESVFHRLTDVTLPLAPEDERTQVLQELTDETKMRLYHPHSNCPHLFSLFPLLFRKYNI